MFRSLARASKPCARLASRTAPRMFATASEAADKVSVTFVTMDGHKKVTVQGNVGDSLSRVAQKAKTDGIEVPAWCNDGYMAYSDWGEGPMCRGCVVSIPDSHKDLLEPMCNREAQVLANVEEDNPSYRTSCTITLTKELDGMLVGVPEDYGEEG
mmetsp:Transcript_10033/g.11420  ORF Transcript_10033/g.11420 Transcript_10033/m.11420 type:complete len:155 (+) Transcript_10033:30-494(+)